MLPCLRRTDIFYLQVFSATISTADIVNLQGLRFFGCDCQRTSLWKSSGVAFFPPVLRILDGCVLLYYGPVAPVGMPIPCLSYCISPRFLQEGWYWLCILWSFSGLCSYLQNRGFTACLFFYCMSVCVFHLSFYFNHGALGVFDTSTDQWGDRYRSIYAKPCRFLARPYQLLIL
jgi:hypothetical protein